MFAGQLVASKLVLVVRQLVPMAYKHDVLVAVNTSLSDLYTFVVGIARPAKVCEEVLKEWLAFGYNRNSGVGNVGVSSVTACCNYLQSI